MWCVVMCWFHHVTQGWALRSVTEAGGLAPGSNLKYGKQQLDALWAATLAPGLSFNIKLSGGEQQGYRVCLGDIVCSALCVH